MKIMGLLDDQDPLPKRLGERVTPEEMSMPPMRDRYAPVLPKGIVVGQDGKWAYDPAKGEKPPALVGAMQAASAVEKIAKEEGWGDQSIWGPKEPLHWDVTPPDLKLGEFQLTLTEDPMDAFHWIPGTQDLRSHHLHGCRNEDFSPWRWFRRKVVVRKSPEHVGWFPMTEVPQVKRLYKIKMSYGGGREYFSFWDGSDWMCTCERQEDAIMSRERSADAYGNMAIGWRPL